MAERPTHSTNHATGSPTSSTEKAARLGTSKAAGMKPHHQPSGVAEDVSTDPVERLRDELSKIPAFGPVFETVSTLGDGTIENLVADLENHPSRAVLVGKTLDVLGRFKFLPILEYPNEGAMLVGVRAQQLSSTDLRTIHEIQEQMENYHQWGIAQNQIPFFRDHPERVTYVLLSNAEWETLRECSTQPDKRKDFLMKIDPDRSATITYFAILKKATRERASDIHIEPLNAKEYRVRYRVDGVLQEDEAHLPRAKARALIAKIKVESEMKLDETRLPQDEGISFSDEVLKVHPYLKGYSLRAATLPTPHGEKVVLRIQKAASETDFDLKNLHLEPEMYGAIVNLAEAPNGVVLVSGPTGSGKTTTLYAILKHLNKPQVNILTVENPVEVYIEGIIQSEVHQQAEYDFARALRAFLRLDPDIILVGEVRDSETARIMAEAANTGHLVFSTIHTNDSIAVIHRLLELGVDRTQLENCMSAVISQRLVRVLCPQCIEPYDARNELNQLFGQNFFKPSGDPVAANQDDAAETNLADPDAVIMYRPIKPKGTHRCVDCHGRGYRGRIIVPELWVIGPEERDLIYRGEFSRKAFLNVALAKGMKPMSLAGFELALKGRTTLAELVSNVIRPDEFREYAQMMHDFIVAKKGGTMLKVVGG